MATTGISSSWPGPSRRREIADTSWLRFSVAVLVAAGHQLQIVEHQAGPSRAPTESRRALERSSIIERLVGSSIKIRAWWRVAQGLGNLAQSSLARKPVRIAVAIHSGFRAQHAQDQFAQDISRRKIPTVFCPWRPRAEHVEATRWFYPSPAGGNDDQVGFCRPGGQLIEGVKPVSTPSPAAGCVLILDRFQRFLERLLNGHEPVRICCCAMEKIRVRSLRGSSSGPFRGQALIHHLVGEKNQFPQTPFPDDLE